MARGASSFLYGPRTRGLEPQPTRSPSQIPTLLKEASGRGGYLFSSNNPGIDLKECPLLARRVFYETDSQFLALDAFYDPRSKSVMFLLFKDEINCEVIWHKSGSEPVSSSLEELAQKMLHLTKEISAQEKLPSYPKTPLTEEEIKQTLLAAF